MHDYTSCTCIYAGDYAFAPPVKKRKLYTMDSNYIIPRQTLWYWKRSSSCQQSHSEELLWSYIHNSEIDTDSSSSDSEELGSEIDQDNESGILLLPRDVYELYHMLYRYRWSVQSFRFTCSRGFQ